MLRVVLRVHPGEDSGDVGVLLAERIETERLVSRVAGLCEERGLNICVLRSLVEALEQ